MQSVVARIQGHPDRAHLHEPLAACIGLPVEVFLHSSDPPDPWSGYRACLGELPDCTHVLIVQDDAIPCRNFAGAVDLISYSHKDVPVVLFLGGAPASTAALARRAMIRGQRYVSLMATPFMPLVAVLWPRHKAQEFLRWTHTSRRITAADDGNAGRWVRETKQEVLVSVPSLVQHNDYVASVKGGREHKPGAESWRQAVLLADDGLEYEW